MEHRLKQVESKVASMESKVGTIENSAIRVETHIGTMSDSIKDLCSKVTEFMEKSIKIEERQQSHSEVHKRYGERLDKLTDDVNELKTGHAVNSAKLNPIFSLYGKIVFSLVTVFGGIAFAFKFLG